MKKFIYFNLNSFVNKEKAISRDETLVETLTKRIKCLIIYNDARTLA